MVQFICLGLQLGDGSPDAGRTLQRAVGHHTPQFRQEIGVGACVLGEGTDEIIQDLLCFLTVRV
jgi:hypothetical protein